MTDSTGSDRYVLRISRMTVDKLGVRLYDRVSAVVAELVANACDADAENVVVRVPLATLLARKNRATGEVEGYGHTIEVGLRQTDFKVRVEDTRNPGENLPFEIGSLEIPLMEGTRVDVAEEPVPLPEELRDLPVSGWMGLAKEAYKNEEMAGVRIYARGKIVGTS